jgi:hypothetical protein
LGIGGQKHAVDPTIEKANIAVFIFKERVGAGTWEELTSLRDREEENKITVIPFFPAEAPDRKKLRKLDFVKKWYELLKKEKELTSGWFESSSKSITLKPYKNISHLKKLALELLQELLAPIVSEHNEQPISEPHKPDRIEKSDEIFDFDSKTNIFEYDSRVVKRYRELLKDDVKSSFPDSLSSSEFLREAGYFKDGCLTIAGILLFSKQPSQSAFIPTAIIKCTKYFGNNKTDKRSSKDLTVPFLDQITQARQFVANNIEKRENPSSESMTAAIEYEYPMVAVREIIANAICHRKYDDKKRLTYIRIFSDRIEVSSPGRWAASKDKPLDSSTSLADLMKYGSISRNFRLARAVSDVRMMEMDGRGIPQALDDCQKVNAPVPMVIEQDGFVIVEIYPVSDWDADTEFENEIQAYRKKTHALHEYLPVAGFATHIKVPIDIQDIYIPLRAMVNLTSFADTKFYSDTSEAEKCLARNDAALEIPLLNAFGEAEKRGRNALVILGDPGSGKTTHLSVCFCGVC